MPEVEKIYAVSFVGARYGIREEIVMALRSAGIEIAAFGQGWEGGERPLMRYHVFLPNPKSYWASARLATAGIFMPLKCVTLTVPCPAHSI
jgi:hypothetical protein